MKKTLFVLGAGASKAIYRHFPTGFELIEKIHAHVFGDLRAEPPNLYVSNLSNKLHELIVQRKIDINPAQHLRNFKTKLYDYWAQHEYNYLRGKVGGNISIDAFTNANNEFAEIACYATTHIIRGAEEAYTQSDAIQSECWLTKLIGYAKQSGMTARQWLDKVTIATFNYDRLVEFMIQKHFDTTFPDAPNIDENDRLNNILHAYGHFGRLSEIKLSATNDEQCECWQNIRLITRSQDPLFSNYSFDTVAFYGFGFDKANLQRLFPGQKNISLAVAYQLDTETPNELIRRKGLTESIAEKSIFTADVDQFIEEAFSKINS